MSVLTVIISILIYMAIFAIASVPLYYIIKALKGSTTLAEVMVVNLVGAIIVSLVNGFFFLWGGLIAFTLLFFVYKAVFELDWGKAVLVWLIQLVMVAILVIITLLIEFAVGSPMII